jgi:hypothetical protein
MPLIELCGLMPAGGPNYVLFVSLDILSEMRFESKSEISEF